MAAPEVAEKSSIFEPLTPKEIECDKMFQWFVLNFLIEFIKKRVKGQKRANEVERFEQLGQYRAGGGWDGEGGRSPPLPFCRECRKKLNGLMRKKNGHKGMKKVRREEEERRLKEGIRELKRRMGDCEEEYLNSGIYEEDKRYHRVRRKLIIN